MSDSQRRKIIAAIDTRLWNQFNAENGQESDYQYLRDHRIGALRPQEKMRPSMTVSDAGIRRTGPNDNVSACEMLNVRIALHICDTWEREDTQMDWVDRVEKMREYLGGHIGHGDIAVRVVGDEPLDVFFVQSGQEGDWIIDLEIPFFREVDELENW